MAERPTTQHYWKGIITPGTVCSDLVDFSDFLPTIAEVSGAELPKDRPLDGRSFLPQLRGEKGNPRTSVFVHYDKDPRKENPDFRRVRFACDGSYKLYHDGQIFHVAEDPEEQRVLDQRTLTEQQQRIRAELQMALDSMPAWTPNNTSFDGKLDRPTRDRQLWLRELSGASKK